MSGRSRAIVLAVGLVVMSGVTWYVASEHAQASLDAADRSNRDFDGLSCGPTALLTIAESHGPQAVLRLHEVLDRQPAASRTVTSFYQLAAWAREADLNLVGLKVEPQMIARLPLPIIVHLRPGHFLALTAVHDDRVVFTDREHPASEIPWQEFDRRFSGHVLCLRE